MEPYGIWLLSHQTTIGNIKVTWNLTDVVVEIKRDWQDRVSSEILINTRKKKITLFSWVVIQFDCSYLITIPGKCCGFGSEWFWYIYCSPHYMEMILSANERLCFLEHVGTLIQEWEGLIFGNFFIAATISLQYSIFSLSWGVMKGIFIFYFEVKFMESKESRCLLKEMWELILRNISRKKIGGGRS